MSKRSIRKNRHRGDKGTARRTWPTCVRRLVDGGGRAYLYEDCTIVVGGQSFAAKALNVERTS